MKLLDSMLATVISLSGMNEVPHKTETAEEKLEITLNLDPQTFCMAQNIYMESRNESTAGKVAVGNVTMNRLKSKDFPDTICEVVYEGPHYESKLTGKLYAYKNRCQFSWYCDGQPDVIKSKKVFWEIYELSKQIVAKSDSIIDMTDGALFYHADYVTPTWSFQFKKKVVIDRHIFYHP
jgi:spore germination cell wall hydrolase CwlJ-like protein